MRMNTRAIGNELPAFNSTYELLAEEQTADDIINGIKKAHKKFGKEYDKIYEFFIGTTEYDTCKKIFDFLRSCAFYFVEDETTQTVRSPQAIIAMGKTEGIDCKNYALFAGGVLDAINRSGKQYIPYVYRFVSDKMLDTTPNHVFVVAFPGDEEIWIDPIPPVKYFNQRIKFYYHKDKKFTTMPLYIVSGLQDNLQTVDIGWTIGESTQNYYGLENSGGFITQGVAAVVNFVSSPDNSQNWSAGDWPWWVEMDASNNPRHNFIAFLQRNPNFIRDVPWDSYLGSGVPMPLDQRLAKIRNRFVGSEYQAQLEAELQKAGYNNNTGLFNLSANTTPGQVQAGMSTTEKIIIGGIVVGIAAKALKII